MRKKDIAIDALGDLRIDEKTDLDGNTVRDFSNVVNSYALEQTMNIRLKTNIGEFFLHPEIGSELTELIGKRNTRENAEKGRNYIVQALTKFSYISVEELNVKAIPIDANKIVYSIEIDSDRKVTLALEVDLEEGIRRLL